MSAVASEWRSGAVQIKRIIDPVIARPISLCSNSNVPLSAAAEAVHMIATSTIEGLLHDGIWKNVIAP
jgi:hypothetical protein